MGAATRPTISGSAAYDHVLGGHAGRNLAASAYGVQRPVAGEYTLTEGPSPVNQHTAADTPPEGTPPANTVQTRKGRKVVGTHGGASTERVLPEPRR